MANAVRTLLEVIERTAGANGELTLDQVRRVSEAFLVAEGPLSAFYARSEAVCDATFALASIERKRQDHLGRLIAHPFSHLLDTPGSGIERKHLPQFFAAVRMMLGDDLHAELRARAALIAESHRGTDGLINWDAYHADRRAQLLLERVLVTVARSFRRFDPRKDWFLIVMDSSPSSVSLSSNAFIAKRPEDKASRQFSERQMVALFDAWFAAVHPTQYDDTERAAFEERHGSPPDKVFGPLFVELAGLGSRV